MDSSQPHTQIVSAHRAVSFIKAEKAFRRQSLVEMSHMWKTLR